MDFEDILANYECYQTKSYTGSSNWTAKKYETLFYPMWYRYSKITKGCYFAPICVRNHIPAYVKNDENINIYIPKKTCR